jgi:serine/threonine protein kinase
MLPMRATCALRLVHHARPLCTAPSHLLARNVHPHLDHVNKYTRPQVHRDLKADNCFVDNKTMRVKVADFGTGHVGDTDDREERRSRGSTFSISVASLSSSLASARKRLGTSVSRNRHESWTMSTARGSLMWMSPERFRDERVTRADAKAGDVYRYTH